MASFRQDLNAIIMKFLIVLALVAAAVARPEDGHYDSKYDNFNVDEVITNERLLKAYSHCFIGDGKCTPEGNDFKKWIPEAVETNCAKCTEKQKVLVAKVIEAIQNKLPTEHAALLKKHDPENKYKEELQAFIKKYTS